MQKTGLLIAGLGALTFGLAACSPRAEESAAEATPASPTTDVPMNTAATPAVTGPITAVGKITAIDAAAGAVTLNHQAIPAVQWDAMTMGFAADPAMLKDLKVGDTVSFELKSQAEKTIITKIQKQ